MFFFSRSYVHEAEINADILIQKYERRKKLESQSFLTRQEWSEARFGRKSYPLVPRVFTPGEGLHIYGNCEVFLADGESLAE